MKGRPGFTPSCGDCRYFRKLPETAVYVSSSDGMCCHPTRNGKNRKTPYLAYSHAAACFDSEDKDEEYDGQLRLDVEGGRRMNDLISRKAAIKAIDDLPNCYNGYSDTCDKAYIIGVLEELPSAEKHGRWVDATKEVGWPEVKCSVCGSIGRGDYLVCPWCGARMGGRRRR